MKSNKTKPKEKNILSNWDFDLSDWKTDSTDWKTDSTAWTTNSTDWKTYLTLNWNWKTQEWNLWQDHNKKNISGISVPRRTKKKKNSTTKGELK